MLQGDAVSSVRDRVPDRVEGALRIVDGHVLQHCGVPHKGIVPKFHLPKTEGKLSLWTAKFGRRSAHLGTWQFQHSLLLKGREVWVPSCCQHQRCPDTGAMKGLGWAPRLKMRKRDLQTACHQCHGGNMDCPFSGNKGNTTVLPPTLNST